MDGDANYSLACGCPNSMETSLHRALKTLYAGNEARLEASVGGYRIDVASDNRLVEIQHGSLAAIRDKVRDLLRLRAHAVVVVKPIIVEKVLVKRARKDGPIVSRRRSPKRGTLLDLFDELVHFTGVFPHERLSLEVPLVDVEEWRYPGHGRRRRWRLDDYQIEDQRLLAVHATYCFQTAADLAGLVPCALPRPFDTGHLAESLQVHRWIAQRIAYCFRHAGVVREVGKQSNARLYEFAVARKAG